MSAQETKAGDTRKPLRLWPGVMLVVVQWVGFLLPRLLPDAGLYGLLAAAVCALGIVAWWLFWSRAPWLERLGVLVLAPALVAATRFAVDPTVARAGMGNMLYIFGVPLACLGLVTGAAATRRLAAVPRRAALVAALALACVPLTLIRTAGVSGDGLSDLHWRWTPTPEERLLAQGDAPLPPRPPAAADPASIPPVSATAPPVSATTAPASAPIPPVSATTAPASAPIPPVSATTRPASATLSPANATPPTSAPGNATPPPNAPATRAAAAASASPGATAAQEPDWPGFRGPARDGVVHGVRIATDWSASPPTELWRRAIGPGWSSFAVDGELLYTQEQRGEEEVVACYRLDSGEPVWRHGDRVRHWDSEGGPGPRATPSVRAGRVFSFGATGKLNALDAATGAVVWSRDAAAEAEVERPGWGFAGSPLVAGDLVIVAMAGRLAAYDVTSGERRWLGPAGGGGYSSPHFATIGGVPQILLLRGARSTSVAAKDGALLWEHRAPQPGNSIVQPALTSEGDVLVAGGDTMGGTGIRRLGVAHGPAGWSVEERWLSKGLKPNFNDFVVHEGFAYGFDSTILAAIDLADGRRRWKGGRYGAGQLVLLPEQDLLLVVSEQGEIALVRAAPDGYAEVTKARALEGKTWNHPALVGDRLLVRNGQEMAAFRLARAGSAGD